MSRTAASSVDDSDAAPSSPVIDDGSETDAEPLSEDAAFEMLSCKRRRDVYRYLRQHGGTAELRPLSRQIAAWENDEPVEAVTYKQRARVYTALRQGHLPKMDSCDVVAYDADRGTVSLTERGTDLDVYLDVVPQDDISWSTYYLGLSALTTLFSTLILGGAVPVGPVPVGAGALVVSLLFLASATAHRIYERRMRVGGDGPPPA